MAERIGQGEPRVPSRGPPESQPPELDVSLLSGFTFTCRPGCGLCCFASPRLEGTDEKRLRAAVPAVHVRQSEGVRRVAAHPDGGACELLTGLRCTVHSVRPAPCREFPVSVHIGTRLQATLVLSCPGITLDPIHTFEATQTPAAFFGLDSELESIRARITPAVERLRSEAGRRRRRIARQLSEAGRWVDDDEVRDRLGRARLIPNGEEFLPGGLPSVEDGLERLPMYFDGREGPVVLAQGEDGWEALELSPEGGAASVGLSPLPDEVPVVQGDAEQLLAGYLRYWIARDCFLAAVHQEMLARARGTVVEAALEELRALASDVMARACVRARLRGEEGTRLDPDDIERGIRATDQDWLDRPTWGSRL